MAATRGARGAYGTDVHGARGGPTWSARAFALVVCVVALAAGPAGAQDAVPTDGPPVRVFATIEPDTATVGDRLRLRVRVERPPGVEVVAPDVVTAISPLEVLESAPLPEAERDGLVIDERVFVVAGFEVGLHAVPPLAFRYVDAAGDTAWARTDSTSVSIVSVLPEEEEEHAPRDIKPPVDLPRTVWPFLLAAAVAVALAVAYRYLRAWWRNLRRPAEEEPEEPAVPPRAAHLVAFERLDALRRDDRIGRGEIEGFYVAVTDIVRRYIRDRFAVDAVDMTTTELRPAMLDARIESDEVERTIAFLAHADLAKFAKLHPDAPRARTDLDDAWGFVERTRFRDEEGEGTAGAEPAEGPGAASDTPAEDEREDEA